VDQQQGLRLATQHLLDMGHRQIASSPDRRAGRAGRPPKKVPQLFCVIGSRVTTTGRVALASAEMNCAVEISMLRRSAAKRLTYPIRCLLSRGGNGQIPFTEAQLKARISASNHQSATHRRSGCLTKSRPRTADPAKLASPTTSKKPASKSRTRPSHPGLAI
jgi:hypothetical protein